MLPWAIPFAGLIVGIPLLFVKSFVPSKYLQPGAPVFDFADMDNAAGEQLFNEVVGSLSAAFSNYTNDPSKGNRITKIQGDQIGFAGAMSQAVEEAYRWKSARGLEIVKTAILPPICKYFPKFSSSFFSTTAKRLKSNFSPIFAVLATT